MKLIAGFIWLAIASSASAERLRTSAIKLPRLCGSQEQTIWSCSTKQKSFAICASVPLSKESGYMQYRAARGNRIDFVYPRTKRHPSGLFVFHLHRNGASVDFENRGFQYSVFEPMKGTAQIDVVPPKGEMQFVKCDEASDTLTLNSTIEQMKSAGLVTD
jgi:hypothetical protein